MSRLPEKHLHDARIAFVELRDFCGDVDEATYLQRRDLQLIAERELEIIGEALARLRRDFPNESAGIPDMHRIVDLRNIIAHGYDVVDHLILWDVIRNHAPNLLEAIEAMLDP